jgi:hypothetical protein
VGTESPGHSFPIFHFDVCITVKISNKDRKDRQDILEYLTVFSDCLSVFHLSCTDGKYALANVNYIFVSNIVCGISEYLSTAIYIVLYYIKTCAERTLF